MRVRLGRVMLFLFASLLVGKARTFTDERGRKLEATLIGVEQERVELRLDSNSKLVWVPIQKLSKKDQKYVREWSEDSDQDESSGKKKLDLPDNFDAPWPDSVTVDRNFEIQTVEENAAEKRFVYHSPNYEFVCDVRLSQNLVKKISVLFEATREYCRLLPISSLKAHVPGAQFRNKIFLFETEEAYIENGGPPGSAGVFMGRDSVVLVPLKSMSVKKVGSGYTHDYDGENDVLVHELAHQLTDIEYYSRGARGWFTEGLAEYLAVTPYRVGRFKVRTNLSALRSYVTAYGEKRKGGRALGEEFSAPNLEDYMLQPYSEFTSNSNFNYGLGALIVYYFFHMEDDRRHIVAFLKALKEGKKGEEALEVLRGGRSWNELEGEIHRAWKSKGVRINFR